MLQQVDMTIQHSLRKALKASQIIFDAIDGGPRTSHQTVALLLYLAAHPFATQGELSDELGVTQQAIALWMKQFSTRPGGLGFLEIERDPENLHRVIIVWTSKGHRLLESIWAAMKGA